MPSRKKAKGKARKAAKEAKAAEAKEEREAVVGAAANQRREESVEALLHRLVINDAMPRKCRHGLVPLSAGEAKIFKDFIDTFTATFFSEVNVVKGLRTATDTTLEEYEEIYVSKLDTVVSIFLCNGTQYILDGNNGRAKLYASFACYFENFMVCLRETQAVLNWTKVLELESADDHTLVSYYRKHIPCSCLDQKYKEVKSVKKMGSCYNPSCSLPGRKAERSKMFSCSQCGVVNYCSSECQRANWKKHREQCDEIVKLRAVFDSEQS